MKQQVSPAIAAVVVLVLVAVIGFAGYKYFGGARATGTPTSSVPADQMSAGMTGGPRPNSGGMQGSGGMSAGMMGSGGYGSGGYRSGGMMSGGR